MDRPAENRRASRWGAIIAILVVMDFCNWAVHLANHRVRMLWRFHELHHSQEDMNVLTVFRTHPLIHVSYLLALIPGVVLLSNGALSVTVLILYGGMVAFAHSNTRASFGILERVFVSPNFHRIHHKLDGPQDVNLGFALTIWDQMFHRAVFPTDETIRTDTGLPGRPLIVEQESARAHHFSVLLAQLVAPFRPMRNLPHPQSPSAPAAEVLDIAGAGAADPSVRSAVPDGAGHAGGGKVVPCDRFGREAAAFMEILARDGGEHPQHLATPSGLRASRRTHRARVDLHLLRRRQALRMVQRTRHSWNLHLLLAVGAPTPGWPLRRAGRGDRVLRRHRPGTRPLLASRGIALFGDMVMAMITVTWATGINSHTAPPGYQLNLALAGLALVVAFLGSGRFSLDAEVERRFLKLNGGTVRAREASTDNHSNP